MQVLKIGGIGMVVEAEEPLPGNYEAFMAHDGEVETHAKVAVSPEPIFPPQEAMQVASGFNDLGESRLFFDGTRYTIGISPCPGEEMRYMAFSEDFKEARISLSPGNPWNAFIIDSMLRIFFSQWAVLNSAFLLHSSAVETATGIHLFMGKSGTGKSTHSSLWIRNFADCRLLNDDNPLVRLNPDGTVSAHGTPWSGKAKCWRNDSGQLLSMTRLRQARHNAFTRLSDVEAFISVIAGVSVISHSKFLQGSVCETLSKVIEKTRVGILECRPDDAAAILCREEVRGKS